MEIKCTSGFTTLTTGEMYFIDGGGVLEFIKGAAVVVGTVMCATCIATGAVAGIGASIIGTPAVGVCAGIAAGAGQFSAGTTLIEYGTSK